MNAIFLTTNQNKFYNDYLLIDRPRGPYLLAHVLRSRGYTAQVIDFLTPNFDRRYDQRYDDITELLDKFITSETSILGFSLSFWTEPDERLLLSILDYVRDRYPWVKILCGGAISFFKIKFMANKIDGLVQGYSENIIVHLLEYFQGKAERPPYKLELPFKTPIYEHTHYDHYSIMTCDFKYHKNDIMHQGESLYLEITRGCIFKCRFCDYQYLGKKRNDYTRDMNLVREELIANYNEFGVTHYTVVDSTFNETLDKCREFADMVESLPFTPSFVGYLRVDLLDTQREMIEHLERANFKAFYAGIETMNRENALMIGKGYNGTIKAKNFLEYLSNRWSKKISLHCSMIVGLPYETEEDLLESKQFFKNIGIPSWSFKPLYIRFGLGNVRFSTSEFDRNHQKYGFVFDQKIQNWSHINGQWNRIKAEEVTNRLFDYDDSKNEQFGVNPYTLWGPLISSGLHTVEDLVTTDKKNFRWSELNKVNEVKLQDYFTRLKNI